MVDSSERSWDEIWDAGAQESPHHGADTLLLAVLEGVEPGRALDLGCGDGSNAIWLAKQGWSVTAVDFSRKALRLGRRSAEAAGADVEFIVADAATYEPQGSFDLITSFYIQLSPDERVAMLSNMRVALNAGGTLLFVSHDRSTPPSGWSKADIATLTSVEEIQPSFKAWRLSERRLSRKVICPEMMRMSIIVMRMERTPRWSSQGRRARNVDATKNSLSLHSHHRSLPADPT